MSNINIQQSTQLTEKVDWEVVEKLYQYALQSTVEDPNNTLTMNLSGNIEVDVAKQDIVRYMSGIDANDDPKFPDLHITVKDNNYAEPIRFESLDTKNIILQQVGGKTGVRVAIPGFANEVTYKQASACVLYPVGNTNQSYKVGKFNEFQYFANTSVPGNMFKGCYSMTEVTVPQDITSIGYNAFQQTALSRIVIPSKVTSIGGYAFSFCQRLSVLILQPIVPPLLSGTAFYATDDNMSIIYVPDESVDAYKQADVWSNYAQRIRPMSEM